MQLSTLASWPALALANTSTQRLFRRVDGDPQGLTEAEAGQRLASDGENRIGSRSRKRLPAPQLALPRDRVDAEYLRRPRPWVAGDLAWFMLRLGSVSSVFDMAAFAVLWWVLGAHQSLFQAGWFAEGLTSQILVVLVIRTSRSRGGARPSRPVLIVFNPAAGLPLTYLTYLPWLAAIVTACRACVRWTKPS